MEKNIVLDLGVLSNDQKFLGRVDSIASEFGYTVQLWKTLDELIESSGEVRLVVSAMTDEDSRKNVAEYAQTIRQVYPGAYIVCAVSGTLGKDVANFAKKSANLILLEEELYESSKLDYICAEIIRASYLPIKYSDLAAEAPVSFDIYHLLPQRKKFIKFLFQDDILSQQKLEKLQSVPEIYIARESAEAFAEYVRKNQDRSAAGLAKRCRAEFLALYASYGNLALLMTDQSEHSSYAQGQELAAKCLKLCKELIGTLASHGNAFEIVNNTSIGCFGSVERAPAIAAYAGLLALQIGMKDQEIDQIMMASLLAFVGILQLPPEITRTLRENRVKELSYENRAKYWLFPLRSLDLVLSRKLPIDDRLRQVMLCISERVDGKGFPRGIAEKKVPEGSQLIQFSKELDLRTLVTLGAARPDPQKVFEALIKDCTDDLGLFSTEFVAKLTKTFAAD